VKNFNTKSDLSDGSCVVLPNAGRVSLVDVKFVRLTSTGTNINLRSPIDSLDRFASDPLKSYESASAHNADLFEMLAMGVAFEFETIDNRRPEVLLELLALPGSSHSLLLLGSTVDVVGVLALGPNVVVVFVVVVEFVVLVAFVVVVETPEIVVVFVVEPGSVVVFVVVVEFVVLVVVVVMVNVVVAVEFDRFVMLPKKGTNLYRVFSVCKRAASALTHVIVQL
jgi:hypothetical protein